MIQTGHRYAAQLTAREPLPSSLAHVLRQCFPTNASGACRILPSTGSSQVPVGRHYRPPENWWEHHHGAIIYRLSGSREAYRAEKKKTVTWTWFPYTEER